MAIAVQDQVSDESQTTSSGLPPQASARSRGWLVPLLIVLFALLVAALSLRTSLPTPQTHAAVGRKLEFHSLQPLLDTSQPLEPSELLGKAKLLHFWGTWCGPCKMEYPSLVELFRETKSLKRFQFISVCCAGYPGQTADDVRQELSAYYTESGFSIPTYGDNEFQMMDTAAATLGQDMLMFPTTILVDGEGTVKAVWQGYRPSGAEEMRALIDDLLKSAASA